MHTQSDGSTTGSGQQLRRLGEFENWLESMLLVAPSIVGKNGSPLTLFLSRSPLLPSGFKQSFIPCVCVFVEYTYSLGFACCFALLQLLLTHTCVMTRKGVHYLYKIFLFELKRRAYLGAIFATSPYQLCIINIIHER